MAQTELRFTLELLASSSSQDDSDEASSSSVPQLDVLSFTLEEALNDCFSLEVELVSFDAAIDFDRVVDHPAVFTIWQNGAAMRRVHGLVSSFEQGITGFRRTHYRAVISPRLSRTLLTSDWRIFQQQTSQDILRSVFKANHILGAEINTFQEHTTREYVVQAGVLDFSFIQRLSAEEGFIYRIASTESDHRLLMTDVIQSFGAMSTNLDGSVATEDEDGNLNTDPVLYNPNAGGDRPQPALRSLVYRQSVRTSLQTQRDYTFKNPRYSLEHKAHGADVTPSTAIYERYDYGTHAKYKQDAAGKPFTQTKIQSLRNDATIATVVGDDARIELGLAFQMTGHSREDLNVYWRAVKISHKGTQSTASEEEGATADKSTSYEQTAELVLATDNWKADIPAPHKIEGPLIAHVTTPDGEELYCDEFGRVKVIFPFQRHEQPNEHSSCWIRVAQNWAGAGWGHMALPRNGQEVIVSFLHGDESQPIITGRSYDALNKTPYKLPALKTLQTTKSKEHKGSGYNELLIDDTTGEIKTQLHTTHEATQLTMGYLTHPRKDDGSGEHRGDGFEVRTDAHGAIRAGKGLYISTDKRDKAEGKQLDMQEAIAQMEHALQIAKEMQKAHSTAQTHQNDTQDQESQFNQVYQELTKAGILISSPEGIATATPKSTQITSNQNLTTTTGKSTDISAWEDVRIGAKANISILAVDEELKVVANKGQMKIQAQNNQMEIAAQKDLKIMSTEDLIEISAEKEILLTSGGAYIRIKGGHIELHAPGIIDHKAASYPFGGPTTLTSSATLPEPAELNLETMTRKSKFVLTAHPEGQGMIYDFAPYKLYEDGALIDENITDEKGVVEYDAKQGASYEIEFANDLRYKIASAPVPTNKDDALVQTLMGLGYRYFEQSEVDTVSDVSKNTQIKNRFSKGKAKE